MTINKVLIVLIVLGLTGCSNKAMYDNIQLHQRNECREEPPAAYFECIERTNKSYEDYQRERKELLEDTAKISGGFDYW